MRRFKIFALTAGAVLMALSSIAVTFKGFTANHWNLIAVPIFVGLAGSFWKLAKAR
ncbi:hypothetical protein [Pseudomonas alabamensis]|uniref:hypothetical protein n=1 Tax=Pseudomonas alabamensis TaxID=3064349 RepID=UPI003F64E072